MYCLELILGGRGKVMENFCGKSVGTGHWWPIWWMGELMAPKPLQ